MIRTLQPFEVGVMVEAGKAFFAEGKVPGTFNPSFFTAFWKQYIETGMGEAIAKFGDDGVFHGALGAVFFADPLTGDTVGTEQFFFILPEYRGDGMKLLDEFEASAKRRGCKRISMIHLESLHPEALKRIYERRGFRHVETAYMKDLQ